MSEKAKPIKFTYDGIDYTLEYSKASLRFMKEKGFSSKDIDSDDVATSALAIYTMWEGAFYKNHRSVKPAIVEETFKKMTNKEKLLTRLGELYAEPLKALGTEPEAGEALSWE